MTFTGHKRSNQRLIKCLLLSLVALIVAFSSLYVVMEAGHECQGESCAVCHMVLLCKENLKGLGYCIFAAFVGAATLCVLKAVSLLDATTGTFSLFTLKTRLNS